MNLSHYQQKKIAILGYGREGQSTFRFLLNHGILEKQITILDKTRNENYLQNLENYDIIFKSAGIPYFPELQSLQGKLTTQVQFFFDHYPGKVIAITASKGKSTMSSLTYELLLHAGYQVKLVGNIGKPVLDEIDFTREYDYVVIELSSYMLATLKKHNFLSILGSFFPEHLDRHGGIEEYLEAKLKILQGSERNIVFSSTAENFLPETEKTAKKNLTLCGKGTDYDWDTDFFLLHGTPAIPLKELHLLWEHNLRNTTAIIALADLLAINLAVLRETLNRFQPIPHRLQLVGTFEEISFYDDAISTTPDSTLAALEALGDNVETIFLGGLDRGYDFTPLVEKIQKSQIKNIVFFPDTGKKIANMLWLETPSPIENHLFTSSMSEAVQFAYKHTTPGKICLLSTASPSYSVWKDFEEKGDLFQEEVRKFGTKKNLEV